MIFMHSFIMAFPFTHTCQVKKTCQDRKRSGFPLYLFFAIYGSKKKDAASTLNALTLNTNRYV